MLLASGLSNEEVLVVMNRKKGTNVLWKVCVVASLSTKYTWRLQNRPSLSYEFDGKALGTITLTATAASPM